MRDLLDFQSNALPSRASCLAHENVAERYVYDFLIELVRPDQTSNLDKMQGIVITLKFAQVLTMLCPVGGS